MSSVATAPKKGFDFKAFLANNGALVGLVILCLALFIATPRFLTGPNLLNIGIQVSTIAVMAFGMTFVIVAAGIDLSVGSVAALSAMGSSYAVTTAGLPDALAIPVGLAIGALSGWVTGAMSAYGKLPTFIASLAMLTVVRGLTLVISDGRPISTGSSVSWLGDDLGPIPMPIIILMLSGLLAAFVLNRTVMGKNAFAVGGNTEAARLSGIPVKRVLVTVFVISGLFAALSGMILAGRLDSAQPILASGYELDAIAAVVIGGASLSGGVGRMSGTLIGALVLAVIRNGLNLLSVSAFWQQVVIGAVIAITLVLAAVFIPSALQAGSAGAVYKQFALTIAMAMLFSAFLALGFTPALCANLLKPSAHHDSRNPIFRAFNRFYGRMSGIYVGHIGSAVRHAPRWMIVFAAKPMLAALDAWTLGWLLAGGLSYTLGTVFYHRPQMRYSHAVWHLFVLGGSLCHFIAVLAQVVPAR